MKLRYILFGVSVMMLSANANFFDNDKVYYDKHPKEAESKVKLCGKAVAIALGKGDMKLAEKYEKDAECKAAKESYFENLKKIRKEKYEAEQKARAEKIAKEKAQYKIDYKNQLVLQKKMPYEEFVKIQKSCGFSSSNRFSAQCKVYKELKLKRANQAMENLISQYQGDDLIAYKKKICEKEGSQSANCTLAVEARVKDEKETIKRLSNDKEALKKVFNECSVEVGKYQKRRDWDKVKLVTQSFKCYTAMAAARSFGVYGLSKPMK